MVGVDEVRCSVRRSSFTPKNALSGQTRLVSAVMATFQIRAIHKTNIVDMNYNL